MTSSDKSSLPPFSTTMAGFILPLTSGLISAFSSILILRVISNSRQKLSTTYHRLMATMSVFDFVASIFMALGTIMIPEDSHFQFDGPTLGTDFTCRLQGFMLTYGLTGGAAMYLSLSWYFVCSITLKMDPVKIKRRVEPLLMLYSLFLAAFFPIWIVSKDLIHPNPNLSYCHLSIIPKNCNNSNWYGCDWLDAEQLDDFHITTRMIITWNFVHIALITVAMLIIVWTIVDKNKKIKAKIMSLKSTRNLDDISDIDDVGIFELRLSRIVVCQAFMYIAACWLTWFFYFISIVCDRLFYFADVLNAIFFPLQGFWNFFIFIYDKANLVRHTDEECKTFWKAVKKILLHPDDTPTMMLVNVSALRSQTEPDEENKSAPASDNEPTRGGVANFSLGSVDPFEVSLPSEFRERLNDVASNPLVSVESQSSQ